MTQTEQRFWDSLMEEVLRKESPPNLSEEILARLTPSLTKSEAVAPEISPARLQESRGSRRRWVQRSVELAFAAGIVGVVIWLAAGLSHRPETPSLQRDLPLGHSPAPGAYAAPGCRYALLDNGIHLWSGWLVVEAVEGGQPLRFDGYEMSVQKGRVLVYTGSPPLREELDKVMDWLREQGIPPETVSEQAGWKQAGGVSYIELSASTVVSIHEAEIEHEVEDRSPPLNWVTVASGDEIRALPPGTDRLAARGLRDEDIPLLCEIKGLQELDLSYCFDLTPDGIGRLESCRELRALSLRYCRMDNEALARVCKIDTLEYLGIGNIHAYSVQGLASLALPPNLRSLSCHSMSFQSDDGTVRFDWEPGVNPAPIEQETFDALVEALRQAPVVHLNFSMTQLPAGFSEALSTFPKLHTLILTECTLVNSPSADASGVLAGLPNLDKLEILDVRGVRKLGRESRMNDADLRNIADCRGLKELWITEDHYEPAQIDRILDSLPWLRLRR